MRERDIHVSRRLFSYVDVLQYAVAVSYCSVVLQCVALCFSVFQQSAAWCLALQRVAACCSVLQRATDSCIVLQRVAVCRLFPCAQVSCVACVHVSVTRET